ncbi:hypothetical protein B0T18DRAFT_393532 [Schizothecium vesticola]|uniref:Uncharacterized protein n=1 Tax=Schizothecium vesticola TaxID=314040 RepID=A0AA40EJZ3_9PEZI|nr:hypothetical protein B0T18DRAFT_393532 [Schizothecium vesticola]
MSRRPPGMEWCRSEGCKTEATFKTIDTHDPLDRRTPAGIRASVGGQPGRGSPNGYRLVSLYCKQHTCIHFFREEGCANKKPQHDAVCAIHARCPVLHCIQARAQYLDSKFEAVPGAVPRYMRYELCIHHGCQSEGCTSPSQERRNCCEKHQCMISGCNTIVEGKYPYCALHVKCDLKGCNMARHLLPRTKEYLRYCENHATCEADHCREIKLDYSGFCANHTCHERGCGKSSHLKPYCSEHMCAEPSCESPRPLPAKQKHKTKEKYCPLHTCREKECHEFVDDLCLFCKDHFKDVYHARGQLAVQRGSRSSLPRHPPKQPYHRGSKPENDPDTASETISDSDSDTSDSEHRKSLPPPPAAPTVATDPSPTPGSRKSSSRRQQARFGHPPVVSHTQHHPKERDQWQQTRRPPGAGAADVTVGGPGAASSRRHQQAGTPEKEKRYWPDGGGYFYLG